MRPAHAAAGWLGTMSAPTSAAAPARNRLMAFSLRLSPAYRADAGAPRGFPIGSRRGAGERDDDNRAPRVAVDRDHAKRAVRLVGLLQHAHDVAAGEAFRSPRWDGGARLRPRRV